MAEDINTFAKQYNLFTDVIDGICRFNNTPAVKETDVTLELMRSRVIYLQEQTTKLCVALLEANEVEIIESASETACEAIAQVYFTLRHQGFAHSETVFKTRQILLQICEEKLIPPPGPAKTTKQTSGRWIPPDIEIPAGVDHAGE